MYCTICKSFCESSGRALPPLRSTFNRDGKYHYYVGRKDALGVTKVLPKCSASIIDESPVETWEEVDVVFGDMGQIKLGPFTVTLMALITIETPNGPVIYPQIVGSIHFARMSELLDYYTSAMADFMSANKVSYAALLLPDVAYVVHQNFETKAYHYAIRAIKTLGA